jgi:hypothetical protein
MSRSAARAPLYDRAVQDHELSTPVDAINRGHGGPTTLGRELDTNPYLRELRAARG